MHRWGSQCFYAALDKELCRCIELVMESRRVGAVWLGNVNDHSLSGAREQNSVAVHPILVFLSVFVCLPCLSVKTATQPLRSAAQKVLSPADAYPVKFQSLNLELSCCYFKLGGRSDVVAIFVVTAWLFASVTI